MEVVFHEAAAEDAHAMPLALARRDLEIRAAIVIDEENVLTVVASLRRMAWRIGNDEARRAGHARFLPQLNGNGNGNR